MRQLKITKSITNRESQSLDKYLQDIGREELITAEEEVELARRIKSGDQKALEKLTRANLRFVVSVAKQYQNQGLSLGDLINEGNMGLSILVKSIAHAKKDENIKGIVLLNNTYSLGAAQSKVVRDALEDFKSSKKFIVSYADMYSQNQYYINSVADTIYLNPVGSIDFKGLATEVMYSKGFQDKIGVEMQVIRHGKYKSAVEGYLDNQMSAENREQLQFLLNDIWNNLVQDIAKSRKLTVEQLNQIAHHSQRPS